jgi:hypothetical protein
MIGCGLAAYISDAPRGGEREGARRLVGVERPAASATARSRSEGAGGRDRQTTGKQAEAHHVAREGEVWTLAEVGVLIERMGEEVRKVRRMFPGAAVVDVRPREPPPPPIDWERGDELPF